MFLSKAEVRPTSASCHEETFPEGGLGSNRIAIFLERRSRGQSLPFAHEPYEVAELGQPALHLSDLPIDPKNPSKIFSARSFVEGFDHGSICLKNLRAARISLAHKFITLTPQGSRYFIQVKLGMVLHAPEHSSSMPDLNRLHFGYRVEGQ